MLQIPDHAHHACVVGLEFADDCVVAAHAILHVLTHTHAVRMQVVGLVFEAAYSEIFFAELAVY